METKNKPSADPEFVIQNLVENGKEYFSNESYDYRGGMYGSKTCTAHVGFWSAFKQAQKEMSDKGIVANMPLLIAAKSRADKDSYLWGSEGYNTFSTDCIVFDEKGKFRRKGSILLVTVHSGFIPAYHVSDGLSEQDLENLLDGILPNGDEIPIYGVEDIRRNNILNPFGKYAVWSDIEKGGYVDPIHSYKSKSNFMNDDLVLARAGSLEYLEEYFDKAKGTQGIYEDKLGLERLFEGSDYFSRYGFSRVNSLFLHRDFEGIKHFKGDYGNFIGG